MLIPASNAINVNKRFTELSCFTTQGYENPVWTISSNGIAVSLQNGDTTTLNENVTVTVNRVSVYHSNISIEINGTGFTSSLICRSENNLEVQSEVILTTSKNALIYIATVERKTSALKNSGKLYNCTKIF